MVYFRTRSKRNFIYKNEAPRYNSSVKDLTYMISGGFILNLLEVNYLAVLVATAVTMVLGFLWYSPVLFGHAWAKQRDLKMGEMSGGGPLTYILTALTALGGCFILALLLTMGTETTWVSGLAVGALIGLSISLKIGMNYLFENAKLPLYFITVGYHLVAYVIGGIIIGAWQG
ncbi:DUF1761 domain-containing protein [Paenibacillus anseongense]|uniref:DUF1761 domain-containing protein n=2 Tax=Paenibacillus TaxID=44249 RepID=UPI002DB5E796|nr:DUF1761 domain-containing protein [Paenibacillus anseongense]MEC0268835.1 DUF1761 domain-containing protein [Paenibacillus anseongense]